MILNISEAANLALHAMSYLADNKDPGPVAAATVTEVFGISKDHLNKVFQRLKKAGLVNSVRGPKGGYSLARDTKDITLLEIYETMDGPLSRGFCLMKLPACSRGKCIFGTLISDVHNQVHSHFATTTLADLILD
jgi:Rrf2 family protein